MIELRKEANKKITDLIRDKFYTKAAIAKILEISLTTLYGRLREKKWTGQEIKIIMGL